MKVNDKVVCIKSLPDSNIKNKLYTILHIQDDRIKISTNPIINLDPSYHYRYFYIDQKISEWYNFNEYFITQQGYRKRKLEKIYEGNL